MDLLLVLSTATDIVGSGIEPCLIKSFKMLINYGLEYGYFPPIREKNYGITNFAFSATICHEIAIPVCTFYLLLYLVVSVEGYCSVTLNLMTMFSVFTDLLEILPNKLTAYYNCIEKKAF